MPSMTAIWLLLLVMSCCAQRCLAIDVTRENLSSAIAQFSESPLDLAIVLPMALNLTILPNASRLDFTVAVDLLLAVIQRRRSFVQKIFHKEFAPTGFVVSESRRVNVDAGQFTLYYYAAFLSTSHMVSLTRSVAKVCVDGFGELGNCTQLASFPSVALYNLLLLSSFKLLPRKSKQLGHFFTDFGPNRTGFVSAQNTADAFDVRHLLCRVFLKCGPGACNLTKVSVPWSVTQQPQWNGYNRYLKVTGRQRNKISLADRAEFDRMMDFDVQQIFQENFRKHTDDFGVYRSWCERSGARGLLPGCFMVILLAQLMLRVSVALVS